MMETAEAYREEEGRGSDWWKVIMPDICGSLLAAFFPLPVGKNALVEKNDRKFYSLSSPQLHLRMEADELPFPSS